MSIELTKDTILYKNDLKYKSQTNINLDKLRELDHPILSDSSNLIDMDSLSYRISECVSTNYKTLDLSGLELTKLPLFKDHLIYNVVNLFCVDNKLEKLTGIEKFKNLLVLDVSGNLLKEITHLPNTLNELVCRNNKLSNINLPLNIRLLDVSFNKLVNLPFSENLVDIVCSNNMIVEILSYPNLKRLICRNNRIKHILKQHKLKFLDCSYNYLTFIDTFDKLNTLYCSDNDITKLYDLPIIEKIECINNKLHFIPFFPHCNLIVCDNGIELDVKYKNINKNISVNSLNNLMIEFTS